MKRAINELPMQPGENSWASEKCGGGPHTSDIGSVHPAVKTVEQMYRVGAVVVPYAGTETRIEDLPSRPPVHVLYTARAHMPA